MLKPILFYSFSIIAIFWESFVLFHPQTVASFIGFLPKKVKDYTKLQLTYGIMREVYFVWLMAGLWSSQKPLFMILVLLGLFKKRSLLWLIINALLSIFILIVIILNRFDWNIDILRYICQHF